MRAALESLVSGWMAQDGPEHAPQHVGLAYDVFAPIETDTGKIPDGMRKEWLKKIAGISTSSDYESFFKRWKESFGHGDHHIFEFELTSRLLVGHGHPAPTEVGITVHPVWGVPMIPGSAIKGVLAHWLEATCGPEQRDSHPLDPSRSSDERERARFAGPVQSGRQVLHGPGDVFRAIFGAPDALDDDEARNKYGLPPAEVGAAQGGLVFEDALYAPPTPTDPGLGVPWALDVLTVHQKCYYRTEGDDPPNDYDEPNPVSFLTIRPGVRFAVPIRAAAGGMEWIRFAGDRLDEALRDWGIGGKTSSGYGRLRRVRSQAELALEREQAEALRALQNARDNLATLAARFRGMGDARDSIKHLHSASRLGIPQAEIREAGLALLNWGRARWREWRANPVRTDEERDTFDRFMVPDTRQVAATAGELRSSGTIGGRPSTPPANEYHGPRSGRGWIEVDAKGRMKLVVQLDDVRKPIKKFLAKDAKSVEIPISLLDALKQASEAAPLAVSVTLDPASREVLAVAFA